MFGFIKYASQIFTHNPQTDELYAAKKQYYTNQCGKTLDGVTQDKPFEQIEQKGEERQQ